MTLPRNTPRLVMMLAAVALAGFAGFAAACGTDGPPIPAEDDGGSADGTPLPSADAATAPDADDGHDPFNGVDAGCPVTVDGPHAGRVATSVPRAGAAGIPWTTPENARTVDGQFARATVGPGEGTEQLRITDFGITTIPSSAKIIGVEVELQRQASDTGIADGNIELWLDGMPSRPKYVATSWPRLIVGTHHYGQAVDTWGNDLTPALVGQPGFGVEVYAIRQEDAGTASLEARVESMRITVFYCP